MLQRVYRQIREANRDATVTVATSQSQVSSIRNQLGENVRLSVEPCRRDTFPAIVLAAAYLHDVVGLREEEPVIVCPVDPYVEGDYFECLKELEEEVRRSAEGLVLMGITPTCPSEKYGYIIPRDKGKLSEVITFKEKPDRETAESYISAGALWNAGVFGFTLGYILKTAHGFMDFTDWHDLYEGYERLDRISFDYAVAEKEKHIRVLRFSGEWKDIGTWNTLSETLTEDIIGRGIRDGECRNVHIINELSLPVLAMGLTDVIISASPDGILVSDKDSSSKIRSYVEDLGTQVMAAEKSWGSYRVLNTEETSLTVKAVLKAGHAFSVHSHRERDEVWVIVSGEGTARIDGMEQPVRSGDVITIEAGCIHTLRAGTELTVIEIQLGRGISVHDKIKYKTEK